MYRKLALSGMCILALMTLVASAEQPPAGPDTASTLQPTVRPLPLQNTPGYVVDGGALYSRRTPFYSNGVQREEIELAHQSEELVKKLAKAEGASRDKIKDQLTDTLGKQFDVRQKRHQAEILALEAQVKKLKELVQKRQDNRREIISKRLDQLAREAEGLGW
jgi:hypothetical protein